MTQREGRIWVGTGGWNYDHWSGRFYPRGLKQTQWLGFYDRQFNTVEITHASLMMVPSVLNNWIEQVGMGFRFSVKVPLKRSQIHHAGDPSGPIRRLSEQLRPLEGLLGPVLLQIPASQSKDLVLLHDLLNHLPLNQSLVMEFRHPSWYEQDVFDLLDRARVGFCIHDLPQVETPRMMTGGIIYMRFHGASQREDWSYTRQQLRRGADWIQTQGHAVTNARQFRLLLALNRIPIISMPPKRSSGHSVPVHQ